MQQLCFMTNMNSSDVAAWVQAVGSIGAILAAIAIGYSQNRSTRRERFEVRCAALESAIGVVSACQFIIETITMMYPAMPEKECMHKVAYDTSARAAAAFPSLTNYPMQALSSAAAIQAVINAQAVVARNSTLTTPGLELILGGAVSRLWDGLEQIKTSIDTLKTELRAERKRQAAFF